MPVAAGPEPEKEDEEFYESLDRILSSSCSSTSASDDDAAENRRRGHLQNFPPQFPPPAAFSYDVWISDPSSIEERRRRLLLQMGLSGDRVLSRSKSIIQGDGSPPPTREEETRSSPSPSPSTSVASSFSLPAEPSLPAATAVRSGSDGSVRPDPVHKQQEQAPLGRDDEDDSRICTIRNLDDGRKFLVNDLPEDGIVSEVGTGRKLTIQEFDNSVGCSPIVQELMRRLSMEESGRHNYGGSVSSVEELTSNSRVPVVNRLKKRGSWLKSIKNMASTAVSVSRGYHWDRRISDERDVSFENGGWRSSSATDDSLDGMQPPYRNPVRIKVRHHGKQYKELSSVYMTQEITGHSGSIWCIKFSSDGHYLASAGEDHVIHVWLVKHERKVDFLVEAASGESVNCNPFLAAVNNESVESALGLTCMEENHYERKRRAKVTNSRKFVSFDHVMAPEQMFELSEKPFLSFIGHLDQVLDLSWSKSQYLLSSSMDKTVRLWHLSSNSCLKTFSHSDYVTCIEFNPLDDRFFISGSLDEKVRLWSIPDRRVVDWSDLHEMVTSVCYTPDGQGALVGSHRGNCHRYDTSDNKLHQIGQIPLHNKKKKSSKGKITGFQFAPGSSTEVLITSAGSRIQVVDGIELVHKFKGFRNTSSQLSATLSPNGKYVICASEDSHVYVWRYDADSWSSGGNGSVTVTHSYESFPCQDVTAAAPWPITSTGIILGAHGNTQNGPGGIILGAHGNTHNGPGGVYKGNPQILTGAQETESSFLSTSGYHDAPLNIGTLNTYSNNYGDRVSATWPEEKLLIASNESSPQNDRYDGSMQVRSRSAWGMVIVTATRRGQIRMFQNFGFPVRI